MMLFLTALLLIIAVGYPIWDYFYMKKVEQNLVNKQKLFIGIMTTQWLLVIIVFVFWVITHRSLNDLFFLDKPLFPFQFEFLLAAGLGIGICIGMFTLILVFSKKLRKILSDALSDESIQFLLPSTIKERLLFLLVAITAGVCEEIIFRGVVVYYLNHLPFELSVITIGIVSSLLFGIVHLYQGWKGVLLTTYLGAILFLLFVGTGFLWIPIVLHIIIDAKFVFLPNKKMP
ncbi:CPBP family intramembrane metalloprotease [Paenibacillus sp. JNUCC31]|uniref:CPBP family intramembrane glutamic endopeptidase n=1 Tax=Paenibacillus sp. JNUCC-31 TaxID=2777983 RepID=UPI00177ED9B9|nr:CPBP family intramembrane glutamic endopeptidase [Paenibacillus sp. JNUCC-31]QOS80588.1 CPBP family intramembrane metalloprotease [Paenibacillus sp. JNUCC-31]